MNTALSLPPPRLHEIAGIYLREAGYEFLRQLRTPAMAIPTLCFPLVFYVMFALVLPGQWGSLQKATYLLATYAVFGVIGPALFGFGVGVAIERKNGWLELKRVAPMPIGAYFFAKIVMSQLFGLLVIILLSIAGIGFGGVSIAPLTWVKLVAVLLLGTLPFSAIGLWIGSLVQGQAAVAIVNLIYLPMSVLSGLWIPLFAFPALLQKAAVIWPAWHLAQMTLGVIGQVSAVDYVWHSLALLLMTGLFLGLATLRWNTR